MDPISVLHDKIAHHVAFSVSLNPDGILVRPIDPSGFSVELKREDGTWTVTCGDAGVHSHFDDAQHAADFALQALSKDFELFEVWEDGRYRHGGTGPFGTGAQFYKDLLQVRRFTNCFDPRNSGLGFTVELIRIRATDGVRAVLDRVPIVADDFQDVIPAAKRLFETAELPQKPDGLRILDDRGVELLNWRPEAKPASDGGSSGAPAA